MVSIACPGCIGGSCEDVPCKFDLICTLRRTGDRLCGKHLGDNDYDFGPEDPAPGNPCDCDGLEVCAVDSNECVNYCEVPDALPGSVPVPEVIFCEHLDGEEPFTFDEICHRLCRVQCQRWEQFCAFTCPAGFCDSTEMQEVCGLCRLHSEARDQRGLVHVLERRGGGPRPLRTRLQPQPGLPPRV